MLLIYLQGYTSRGSFLLTINCKMLCSKNGKKFTTEERCHYRQSIACLNLSKNGKNGAKEERYYYQQSIACLILSRTGKILCSKKGKMFTTEERCHYRQSIACLNLSKNGKNGATEERCHYRQSIACLILSKTGSSMDTECMRQTRSNRPRTTICVEKRVMDTPTFTWNIHNLLPTWCVL